MSRSSCCCRLVVPVTREEHAAVRSAAAKNSVSMSALMRVVSVSLEVLKVDQLEKAARRLRDSRDLDIHLLVRRNNWRAAVVYALGSGSLTARELEQRCDVKSCDRSRDQIRKAVSRLINCQMVRRRVRQGRSVLELVPR